MIIFLSLSLHWKPLAAATTLPLWATINDNITTTRSAPLLLHLLLHARAPSTVLQMNSGEFLHYLLRRPRLRWQGRVRSSSKQNPKKSF
jgi:hypothetical protein